jgi:predicted amidohydrolase YtcJ
VRRTTWLGLLALGCGGDPPAEQLFAGGTFHLGDGSTTDALAAIGGVVVATGDAARARADASTAQVDLGGGHGWPGFHDSHVHLLAGSFAFDRLLLLGVSSMELLVSKVEDYAAGAPDEPWIVGYGWFTETLEGANGVALDAVLPDRPALLVESSGHAALVNSAAMARCGIDMDTPDPAGGTIVRDEATGAPTGLLFETALSLCSEAALADYGDDLLATGLQAAMEGFSEGGVTSVSEILASPGIDLSRPWIYRALEAQGALPLRVFWYAPVFAVEDLDALADAAADDTERVRFAGGKIWVDGSMGTGQAWVSEAHVDDPDDFGQEFFPAEDLFLAVERAEALGVPLKLHVNGDAAVSAALDAFEAVAAANGGLLQPHVLDHAVLVAPEDLARFVELGLPASVQPAHYLGAQLGDVVDQWGEERFDLAYDFGGMAAAGVQLAMGTDWPVWPTADPLVSVWAATRADEGSELSVAEGIAGYTLGSARAVGAQDWLGGLLPGQVLDLVVTAEDLEAVDPDALTEVRIEAVYLGGEAQR